MNTVFYENNINNLRKEIDDDNKILNDEQVYESYIINKKRILEDTLEKLKQEENKLNDVKDIIKNPKTVAIPNDISAQLMIIFQAVDTLETQDELTKFMEFLNRIPSSEVQAVFFTMMMRTPKSIKLARNNAQITDWARNNHELF